MEQSKSLSQWRFDLKRGTPKTWVVFYQDFLGAPPSSYPRFYKAIKNYGFWPMFESIVESADRELTGDPLNYVLAVAKNKWKEREQEDENEDEYLAAINQAKEKSKKQNDELAKKLASTRQGRSGS